MEWAALSVAGRKCLLHLLLMGGGGSELGQSANAGEPARQTIRGRAHRTGERRGSPFDGDTCEKNRECFKLCLNQDFYKLFCLFWPGASYLK